MPTGARAVARSVDRLLREASRRLLPRAGDAVSARIEAELLLALALDLPRARLLTLEQVPLPAQGAFELLLDRRCLEAVPVCQLLGRRGFLDFELAVDRRVLAPRPETEGLVEVLQELLEQGALPEGCLADWGTGSGALAVACSRLRPVLALERSADAREVAATNLRRLAGPFGWLLLASDGLAAAADSSLAAVLANPPYVEAGDWPRLPDDVRLHEPAEALVPSQGSVAELYARLGRQAQRCLKPGGWLLVEVGAGQAERLERALGEGGLQAQMRRRDLQGHERVLALRRP